MKLAIIHAGQEFPFEKSVFWSMSLPGITGEKDAKRRDDGVLPLRPAQAYSPKGVFEIKYKE